MFELRGILVSDFVFYSQILFAAAEGGEAQTHAGQTASKKQNVYFGLQSREVWRHNIGAALSKQSKMPPVA